MYEMTQGLRVDAAVSRASSRPIHAKQVAAALGNDAVVLPETPYDDLKKRHLKIIIILAKASVIRKNSLIYLADCYSLQVKDQKAPRRGIQTPTDIET